LFDHSVEAVLFDAGGVLLLPDPDAMRRALAPFGVAPDDEACRRAHYLSTREIDRLGRVDWREADHAIARHFGIDPTHFDAAFAAIESVYDSEAWRPVDGAARSLRALQAAGVPLAIVSNAGGTMEQQLSEHRICGVGADDGVADVAVVIDSHVVGVEKPDPAIFHLALAELGIEAQQCAYVGDTVFFDVAGARGAGLTPVHVDPYGLCDGHDHPHVTSVVDFVDRFEVRT
jgi:putative hydrolase of the HAD superfamily